MTVRKLQELPIEGKRVLVRVDFNVPFKPEGGIADDTRLRASLPTLRAVLERGGSLILLSHLGRPKGKVDPALSLAPLKPALEQLLGVPVQMAQDCVGPLVKTAATTLKPGEVLLLENVRFHPGEERPETEAGFVEELVALADFYVDDAFGSAHRKHASTYDVPKAFGDRAAAGYLLQNEVKFLGESVLKPARPFEAIIGGSKVSSKLGVLRSLSLKADQLFIGGAMAFTFLKAQGYAVGDSLVEEELLPEAAELLRKEGESLVLPIDVVIAQKPCEGATTRRIDIQEGIPGGWKGFDIGPKTLTQWKQQMKGARTILWNGPVGLFEVAQFSQGTKELALFLARCDALTIVGGGDSLAAINAFGLGQQFDHLSTGGGASLAYLEFGTLPGIEALQDARNEHKKFSSS